MIDLSKYEKVYSWDSVYGYTLKRRVISSTVVYLIQIGGECYIDETYEFNIVCDKHVRDLTHGTHLNEKMQELYNKFGVCDFYILAQVGLFEHPYNMVRHFIKELNPTLNEDKCIFKFTPSFWRKDTEDGLEVTVKIPDEYISKIKIITEEQGISLQKFVEASVITVLEENTYRDVDTLMNEGVAMIDNYLGNKKW